MDKDTPLKKFLIAKCKIFIFIALVIILSISLLVGAAYVKLQSSFDKVLEAEQNFASSVKAGGATYKKTIINEAGKEEVVEVTIDEIVDDFTEGLEGVIDREDPENVKKVKRIIEASTATISPYDENVEGNLGIVKFYRLNSNTNQEKELAIEDNRIKYIEKSKFEEYKKAYQNIGDNTVFKHFTLDDEGNLIIAYGKSEKKTITTNDADFTEEFIQNKSGETEYKGSYDTKFELTRYTIEEKKIPYLSLIEQYTMPLSFLNALLVETQNIDFVAEIAEIAYDSEISIGIFDNESTNTYTKEYDYNKLIDIETSVVMDYSELSIQNPPVSAEYLKTIEEKIPSECSYDNIDTNKHETVYINKNHKYDCTDINNNLYIKSMDTSGISQIGNQPEENLFTAKYEQVINEKSSPTVEIILADTWISKWESTYTQVPKNIPETNDNGTISDKAEMAKYSTAEEFINAFSNEQTKTNLSAQFSNHATSLKNTAINLIYGSQKENITFKEITKDNISTSQKNKVLEQLDKHIESCDECKQVIGDKKIGKEAIHQEIINSDGKLRGTIVENHYDSILISYIDNANETKRVELENQFKKELENAIKYSQTLQATRNNVNIEFMIKESRTSTSYKKDSIVEREDNVEKFETIFNKKEYYDATSALIERSDWFFINIEKAEISSDLENIIRYILNRATNSQYFGDFSEEQKNKIFDAFEPKGEQAISTTSGVRISKYLMQFGGDGAAEVFDGVEYFELYNDTSGNPTIGPGDVQWKSNHPHFNIIGTVRYGGEGGTVYENCNVLEKVNELLGEKGAQTTWDKNYNPSPSETIYVDAETVYKATDSIQSGFWDEVIEETSGLNLSKQQLYALTYIDHATGNLDYVATSEAKSELKSFKTVYNEALNEGYEENTWKFNRYIWKNWWSVKWDGGYSNGRSHSGWLKGRDASFETYVKGTFIFEDNSAGKSREKNGYMFYSKEQIASIGFATDSKPYGYAKNRDITSEADEIELFTYIDGAAGTYTVENDDKDIHGTYISSSGRTYREWKQITNGTTTTSNMEIKRWKETMGSVGCGMYSATMLLNSVGLDVRPENVLRKDNEIFESRKSVNYSQTIKGVLDDNKMNSSVKTISTRETLIKVLLEGRGTMTYMRAGDFTNSKHWIVLADIRQTQFDCATGYDVYVLTSSGPSKGGGWQTLSLVEKQLFEAGEYGMYIAD